MTPAPLPSELAAAFPAPIRMEHRAILSIRGRELSLSGHLVADPDRGLRLLILHTFGQVLADVAVAPSGNVSIWRRADWFREAWVRDYLIRDAVLLFAPGLAPGGTWNRCATTAGSAWERPLGQADQRLFCQDDAGGTGRLMEIRRGETVRWRAEGLAARDVPGLTGRQPGRYRIQGETYSLDLTVLSTEPATNTAAFFPAEDNTLRR